MSNTAPDFSPDLQGWVGKTAVQSDVLHVQPACFMQATLDREPSLSEGDAVPPLWHWLYFLEARRISDLGRDSHAKLGGFLPPVPLPRRMWAGGKLTFDAPLILGQEATRHSQIKAVTPKQGRSGSLCFVTVRHGLRQNGQICLTEEHDIVYREDPIPGAPAPKAQAAPVEAEFSRVITPTPVMLFRYSALTFNGHRIHYDADYARDVEGYEGLVFHGPLTATLLADLAVAQSKQPLSGFEYRGHAPLAGLSPFHIEGRREGNKISLWARRHDGALAMSATARF